MQAMPYVGMPAIRRYLPSVAPVDIVGTMGTPGHIVARVRSRALVTSGSNGGGGTVTIGMACPSAVFCTTAGLLRFGFAAGRLGALPAFSRCSAGEHVELA